MKIELILASQSPRRKELLAKLDIPFSVLISHVDENILQSDPQIKVEELSKLKAQTVWKDYCTNISTLIKPLFVIGADTLVCCDGKILEKPKNLKESEFMLRQLNNRSHTVYTAVTLLTSRLADFFDFDVSTLCVQTEVTFGNLCEDDIHWYVAKQEGMDKAGAYGIQDKGLALVKEIKGSYSSVVGLPLYETKNLIQEKLSLYTSTNLI